MKNKVIQVSKYGGMGVVGIIASLFINNIDTKVAAVDLRHTEKNAYLHEYIDQKDEALMNKLDDLEGLLIIIDERLYEMKGE